MIKISFTSEKSILVKVFRGLNEIVLNLFLKNLPSFIIKSINKFKILRFQEFHQCD